MKKILTNVLMITLFALGFMLNETNAQCQQFNPQVIDTPCDDKDTDLDPSDDEFTVNVSISNGLNPNGTWSTDDGSFTNEPYPPNETATFGPYLISDGDVVVTFTDDQFNCTQIVTFVAPEPCSAPPVECADWNDCVNLVSSDGCTHTFVINLTGDADFTDANNPFPVNFINVDFSLNGDGSITSAQYIDASGYYSQNNVTLTQTSNEVGFNFFSTSLALEGFELVGDVVEFTVEAEDIPSCFTVSRDLSNRIGIFDDGTFTFCDDEDGCDPIEVCTEGITISGVVEAFAEFSSCNNTENLGIQGAEMTIQGASGSCTAETGSDGTYECTLCEGGPYEVCVETVCEEPCGVTSLDIILLRKIILGVDVWNPYANIIGDVNNSGMLSTLDLVLIQRELLGLDTDFIENWCAFIPTSALMTNTTDLVEEDNCTTFEDQNFPIFAAADFVRFMKGDINGSCSDCIHGDGFGDVLIASDDTDPGIIKIKVPNQDMIHGLAMQFSIPAGTKFGSVQSSLPNLLYNEIDGEIHIIWTDGTDENDGFDNSEDPVLLEITFDGEKPTMIGEENLILASTGEISNLVQQERPKKREQIQESIQVLNIVNMTSVELYGESSDATVELYSMTGVLLEKRQVNMSESTSVEFLQQANLGIYIVRVYNSENDITKKVFWYNE